MGVFVGSVVLNVSDSDQAAEFWCNALGYVRQKNNPEFLHPTNWRRPSNSPDDLGGTHVHLARGDKTHLDLWVDRRDSSLETEVERLVSLGARRVDWVYPDGAEHVVLADTEGNPFCVIG